MWNRFFKQNISGNVGLAFGLSAFVVMGALGAAIDYQNAVQVKTKIQSAADSGVLQAINQQYVTKTTLTNDQISAMVNSSIQANIAADKNVGTPTIAVTNANGIVTADVTVSVQNKIMKIFGLRSSSVHSHAAATYMLAAGGKPNEVSLVLDITYSMTDNGKYIGLKNAATNMINTLLASPQANTSIAIVPYAAYVNVGTQYQGQPWLKVPQTGLIPGTPMGCTFIPDGGQNCTTVSVPTGYGPPVWVPDQWGTCYKDGIPYSCVTTAGYWYNPPLGFNQVQQCTPSGFTQCNNNYVADKFIVWNGLVGSRGNPLDLQDAITSTSPVTGVTYDSYSTTMANVPPLQRLTKDKATLLQQVASLWFDGETYIPTGLLWGWRTLSPKGNMPFGDGADYKSASKYLVLMTDGFNTLNAPADSALTAAQAQQQALQAYGITIDQYNSDANLKSMVDRMSKMLLQNSTVNDIFHDGTNAAAADTQMLSTCDAIKATGIIVFTITFEVNNAASNQKLMSCASDSKHYFNANDNAGLNDAFSKIATTIASGASSGPRLIQ